MEQNVLIPKPYKITQMIHHTPLECTFRVSCDIEPGYGQFFMLSLPTVGEAPISASGKGPGYVEFTIRNIGYLTQALFDLEPGNTMFIRGPYGNQFPISQFENKDILIIAGGTGVAPVMTTINHFYNHPEVCKSVNIIAGFKNKESVLFKSDMDKFQERFNVIKTLDNETCDGYEKGFVTEHIEKIPLSSFTDYNVVIVGPTPMMRAAAAQCVKQGVEESKIWVSFERKMCCGLGKCGHCKINDTYICIDGPVFNYADAKDRLMD